MATLWKLRSTFTSNHLLSSSTTSRHPIRTIFNHSTHHNLASSSSPPPRSRVIASLDGGPKTTNNTTTNSHPIASNSRKDAKLAFYTMGRILRALIYTSLGLGTSATLGFLGLHLWVETFELPPPSSTSLRDGSHEDLYGWEEELEGWSGTHLGQGTDPRLGWEARGLIRSAWVASHWQTGQRALSTSSSDESEDEDRWMIDSGYAIAENRLQAGLILAQERHGLQLYHPQSLDKALIELENRLASVCELINTPLSIQKASQIYRRLWEACSSLVEGTYHQVNQDGWEKREGIRTACRLADMMLKLSTSELLTEPQQTQQARRSAEEYLIWAISQGLSLAVGDGEVFRKALPVKADERKTSQVLNFFRSSKSSSSLKSQILSPLKEEIELVETTLEALNQSLTNNTASDAPRSIPISPPATRATISALTRLIVHLVSIDLKAAYNLQDHLYTFLQRITSIPQADDLPDARLYRDWLKTREALASVYLAQLGEVTEELTDLRIQELYQSSIESIDMILEDLRSDSNHLIFEKGWTRKGSGRLSEAAQKLRQEARTTGTMASNLLGVRFQKFCNASSDLPHWCGSQPGQLSAIESFQRALRYSDSKINEHGKIEDQRLVRLWEESRDHLQKVEGDG